MDIEALKQKILRRISSERPSRYRVLDGGGLYVHCAGDVVLYAIITGKRVRAEVVSPRGDRYEVEIDPEKPREDLYVSVVRDLDPKDLPESPGTPSRVCPYINFFRSYEEFQEWRSGIDPKLCDHIDLEDLGRAIKRIANKLLKELEQVR